LCLNILEKTIPISINRILVSHNQVSIEETSRNFSASLEELTMPFLIFFFPLKGQIFASSLVPDGIEIPTNYV